MPVPVVWAELRLSACETKLRKGNVLHHCGEGFGFLVFMETEQTLELLGYCALTVCDRVFTEAPRPCDPQLSVETGNPALFTVSVQSCGDSV